jgi:PIN domain
MRKPKYLDWEHILLDTSVIFSYLQSLRGTNTDKRCDFVKKVIDDLVNVKTSRKKNRQFYISAITISELLNHNKTEQSKVQNIIEKLRISNTTIVSFDEDVATFITENYHQILGSKKLSNFTKEIGIDTSKFDMNIVREWMTKDLMIIGTSQYMNCDVALTLDDRTFKKLGDKVGYPCCLLLEDKFNHSDGYVFEYKY